MEIRGFEPLTYGLQSRRSSQLSYIPWLFAYGLRPFSAIKKGKRERRKRLGYPRGYLCVRLIDVPHLYYWGLTN